MAAAAAWLGTSAFSAASYRRIIGANDRVRVGVAGFADRFRDTLGPCFLQFNKNLNFEFTAISDIWSVRREQGLAWLKERSAMDVRAFRNNDELYNSRSVDAVFISTADFQHALMAIEAVKALSLIHI